ncbi:MAG: hypothetical protein KGL35_32275 [Bradyrhizobium sp.]|nr:hypothetical protein [Bradyrhizobium sp.]
MSVYRALSTCLLAAFCFALGAQAALKFSPAPPRPFEPPLGSTVIPTKELVELKEKVHVLGHRLGEEHTRADSAEKRAKAAEAHAALLAGQRQDDLKANSQGTFTRRDIEAALEPVYSTTWDYARGTATLWLPGKVRKSKAGALELHFLLHGRPGESPPDGFYARVSDARSDEARQALLRAIQCVTGPPQGEALESTSFDAPHGELVGRDATARFRARGGSLELFVGNVNRWRMGK